ncbi:MAG: phage tail sheath family protein [Clostridiales bacterium]|nr:phage tail sheath family protein [Clostridiales bacterium]
MQAFNAAGKAPGVYMQEVDVPGPISGVSTGIAAIVGPAQSGPLNTPVFVTNWTQFLDTFGGYIYDPPVYAAHAVRGFFENGGATCCFVRAGVARQASLTVVDRSSGPNPVFTVTARAEGKQGEEISIAVSDARLCETEAGKCAAEVELLSADRKTLTLGSAEEARSFLAGDAVCVVQGSLEEEAEVALVAGKEILLTATLVRAFSKEGEAPAPITLRLADLQGKKRLRLKSSAGLEPGSYIQLSQPAGSAGGEALVEHAVVEGLDGDTALLRTPLQQGFSLHGEAGAVSVRSLEFSLDILLRGVQKERYQNLSVVPYHARYYEKLTADSALVCIAPSDPPNGSLPPDNLPDPDCVQNQGSLQGGVNDNPGQLTPEHYRDAIAALEKAIVNIVCVPDAVAFDPTDAAVRKYAVEHCERMGDRFAVLDCGRNLSVQGAIQQRMAHFGASSYAAAYYPWIEIPHPAGQGRLKVPPSGHIAGVYARTDDQKGVHKAPGNEGIRGCLGPAALLNDTEHGMLNEAGVNAIVNLPGSGATLMGARTLSSSTQWRYINVRRLLLYIEKSIQNATRFAVFLPNNPSLWAAVKRQVSDFLNTVWRSGALFGATPGQAFYVKVDEELNPPSVRALGQLIIEIVLYPVTPAEFVVFRVIQQPGGANVSEGE